MKRKYGVILLLSIFCLLVGWGIQKFSATFYTIPIAKVEQVEIKGNEQQIQAVVKNGENKGEQVSLTSSYRENEIDSVKLQKGDQVFFQKRKVVEKKRDGFVAFLVLLLFLCLVIVGGKNGVTTFVSVAINTMMLFLMVTWYRHHQGVPLLMLTAIYVLFSIAITLFLIEGIQKNSGSKFLTSAVTVFLSFGICYLAMSFFHDKGLRFEEMGGLTRPYRPIYLSGLLIGATGATLDTVVTVLSTLEEIEERNNRVTFRQLIASGKKVGKDIGTTMINVLICSYFSSTIPMFMVYLLNGWLFSQTANHLLSLEVIRVLCGSFGILLSIPVSLFFFQLNRRREK